MSAVEFFVPGVPKPAGSKRAFPIRRNGRIGVAVVDASGEAGKNWRETVALLARRAMKGEPFTGPLSMSLTFYMPRPKSHLNARHVVRENAPHHHTRRPDATKLVRAVEDAMTGIVWRDDSQVCEQHVWKVYGDNIGVHVRVDEVG